MNAANLLALGYGRGAHAPTLPTAAAGPAIPRVSDNPNSRARFARLDAATQAYLIGLGYGPPSGQQPSPAGAPAGASGHSNSASSRSYDRWAPVGAAEANAHAIDWSAVAAEQNARAGLHAGANLRGQGHQPAAAPIAPAPTQASANLWDEVIREQNAKLLPNAVIPGQRGGR